MVPGQTRAVILTFPVTDDTRQLRTRENEKIEKIPVDPNVIWIKQTVSHLSRNLLCTYVTVWIFNTLKIGNACGTMAVLHSLMNVSEYVKS